MGHKVSRAKIKNPYNTNNYKENSDLVAEIEFDLNKKSRKSSQQN